MTDLWEQFVQSSLHKLFWSFFCIIMVNSLLACNMIGTCTHKAETVKLQILYFCIVRNCRIVAEIDHTTKFAYPWFLNF